MVQVPSCGCDKTVVVSGEVEVSNDVGNPLPVTGALTISQPTISPIAGSFEQFSVGALAVGLTVPAGADVALIQNQSTESSAGVRWRDDGTSPTAAVGMILPGGVQIKYTGDLSAIEFINIQGGADVLAVSYYEYV